MWQQYMNDGLHRKALTSFGPAPETQLMITGGTDSISEQAYSGKCMTDIQAPV